MKKWMALLMAAAVCLGLTGCGIQLPPEKAADGLYWPQLVLFDQSFAIRLRNCILFCVKYFWRVMGAGLIQLVFIAVYVLFAPWSVLLLPVIGAWYIVFLAQFLIYDQLNDSLRIEEQYDSHSG